MIIAAQILVTGLELRKVESFEGFPWANGQSQDLLQQLDNYGYVRASNRTWRRNELAESSMRS